MSDEIDHIAKLEEKLYARNPENIPKRRFGILHPIKQSTSSSWGQINLPKQPLRHSSVAGYKRFFIFTFIFFLISLAIALFSFYRGAQSLSSKNVEINILGNSYVAGGEELPIQVEIANKNKADLVGTKLVIDYPKGATDATGSGTNRIERVLGNIESGKTRGESFVVVLYGEQGSSREIKATLTYSLAGSTATFQKSNNFSVIVNSSPVTLSVDYPSAVVSNQSFTLTIHSKFTGDKMLNNVVARIEYPNGFVFDSSNPSQAYSNNVWTLGDLEKDTERTITITGRLMGEDNDEKNFRIYIGTPEKDISSRLAIAYNSTLSTIKISEASLSGSILINEDKSGTTVLPVGSTVVGYILWKNNSPLPITNPYFTLSLLGESIDLSSIEAQNSYYNESEKAVIWNASSDNSLVRLEPGDTGRLPFSFATLSSSKGTKDINLALSIRGNFPDRNNVEERIDNIDQKTIKFASNLNFTAKAQYSLGPIKNIGPYPPKVDKETTYSIVWTLNPSENQLTKVSISAILPPSIAWAGVIVPNSENVVYNPNTRVVTWEVGSIPKASLTAKISRSLTFQIRTRPTKSQINQMLTLLGVSNVVATDAITNTEIKTTSPELTTLLIDEPMYSEGMERVVP